MPCMISSILYANLTSKSTRVLKQLFDCSLVPYELISSNCALTSSIRYYKLLLKGVYLFMSLYYALHVPYLLIHCPMVVFLFCVLICTYMFFSSVHRASLGLSSTGLVFIHCLFVYHTSFFSFPLIMLDNFAGYNNLS